MKRMKWTDLLLNVAYSTDGRTIKNIKYTPARSPFLKDQDKILFSSAFRRLAKKTQVHPLIDNDHIHTRLTHSIEVASVGRSLGNMIGQFVIDKEKLDGFIPQYFGEIVQAACFAHDIGNPPFGHAGESAIQSWFNDKASMNNDLTIHGYTDFKHFDGNAMGFRVLTKLEHDQGKGGMRLSFPTLATTLKYPWTSSYAETINKSKFSCLKSETSTMNEICERLGMIPLGDNRWARHPLTYLVEAADDICYRLLDLEDARELRIVSYKRIKEICDPLHAQNGYYTDYLEQDISDRRKLSFIRGITIEALIKDAAKAFENNYEKIMKGELEQGKGLTDLFSDPHKEFIQNAKKICEDCIYKYHRKTELEIGSYTSIGSMLDSFVTASEEFFSKQELKLCSYKTNKTFDLLGVNAPKNATALYDIILPFIDYISGMTDSFATHICRQINGLGYPEISR